MLAQYEVHRESVVSDVSKYLGTCEPWKHFSLNPMLYKIGIENACFSQRMFVGYLFYGLWYAGVIYWIFFYLQCSGLQVLSDGQDIGFWVAGDNVYGVCIIIVNLVLLHRLHLFEKYGMGLYAFSIGCYFLFMFVQSLTMSFPKVYGSFGKAWG